MVVWQAADNYFERLEDEHESGNGGLEIPPHRIFETLDVDDGGCLRHTELVDERQNSSRRDTAPPQGR